MTKALPTIKFKYLKNINISLGNGKQYPIPTKMINSPSPYGTDKTRPITRPDFNMDFVHVITLEDETPRVVVKEILMSDDYHEALQDAEIKRAMECERKNNIVRTSVYSYAERGVIEVVEDKAKKNYSYADESKDSEHGQPKFKSALEENINASQQDLPKEHKDSKGPQPKNQ